MAPAAPSPSSAPFVCGLVLAAGGSRRLGRPKQLLPYGKTTLLDHVLQTARACPFDQTVWKLMDRHAAEVVDVPIPGPIPADVDTWEDYEAVLAALSADAGV